MPTQLNHHTYCKLIAEDIEVMCKSMPDNLERRHIIDVLKWSVKEIYDEPYKDPNDEAN